MERPPLETIRSQHFELTQRIGAMHAALEKDDVAELEAHLERLERLLPEHFAVEDQAVPRCVYVPVGRW